MKILWVKAGKLLPLHNGGNIRTYHILRELASRFNLTFFSYYDGHEDPGYQCEIQSRFPGAVALCTRRTEPDAGGRALDYLLHLPRRAPYAASRFACSRVRQQLRTWFDERSFDVVVCDFLDAAVNFPRILNMPTVLFQHNVESEIWRRHASTASNPVWQMAYRLEFWKMLHYERRTLRRFHQVVAVSQPDRELMSRWIDGSCITVVPTGVDLLQYHPVSSNAENPHLVMFVGSMDWAPNVDAVEHFSRAIWPLILAKVPSARFRIVGRNPGPRVNRLVSGTISVTGSVASVAEQLAQAAVVVVPLRVGGGTRLKIYEAMATGRALVSTSIGAEGLDVHHGRDILLADDPAEFANAVIGLLVDESLRRSYGSAAAALAAQYGWPAIGRRFAHVLETAASASRNLGAEAMLLPQE